MMHGQWEVGRAHSTGEVVEQRRGHAAAETMEGRGGAKGNAAGRSTRQTQSWESASRALGRVRETARREKRVRFTALLHHVTVDRCAGRSSS